MSLFQASTLTAHAQDLPLASTLGRSRPQPPDTCVHIAGRPWAGKVLVFIMIMYLLLS